MLVMLRMVSCALPAAFREVPDGMGKDGHRFVVSVDVGAVTFVLVTPWCSFVLYSCKACCVIL